MKKDDYLTAIEEKKGIKIDGKIVVIDTLEYLEAYNKFLEFPELAHQ